MSDQPQTQPAPPETSSPAPSSAASAAAALASALLARPPVSAPPAAGPVVVAPPVVTEVSPPGAESPASTAEPSATQAPAEGRGERAADGKRRRRRRGRRSGRGAAEPAAVVDEDALRIREQVRQIVVGYAHEAKPGRHRFYYEARDGRVPYLSVSEASLKALAEGRITIAESPEGQVHVIEGAGATRVAEIDATWLRVARRR